jgi:IS4 transposase
MNQGRTFFAQVTELLPRRAFENAVQRYAGDWRVAQLSSLDHLLVMLLAQFTALPSLRQIVTVLRAMGPQCYHCGIGGPVARSTLADANQNRDYRIFQDTALAMIDQARRVLPRDPQLRRLRGDILALDSTTIDLCLKLFPWAHFRRRKAGIKAHTLLDLRVGVPVFLRVSPAKTHDLWMLDQIVPQAGAFYVLDRGYCDFARLYRLHTAGAFFVTRAKRNLDYVIRRRHRVAPDGPVRWDRLVRLRGPKSRRLYPDTLRLVRYVDPDTGKRFIFLTNHQGLAPRTVALLYRKRWRIELFFKWIKQHLHIEAFFGTSDNAVQTQIWIAVIAYVLIVRLKHRYQLQQDPHEIMQVLKLMSMEKKPVSVLFSDLRREQKIDDDPNQLRLFDL